MASKIRRRNLLVVLSISFIFFFAFVLDISLPSLTDTQPTVPAVGTSLIQQSREKRIVGRSRRDAANQDDDSTHARGNAALEDLDASISSSNLSLHIRQSNEARDINEARLSERALGFLTWRRLKRQGKLLSCLLDGGGSTVQSRWTLYEQLAEWGWSPEQEEGKDYTHVDGGWQSVAIGQLVGGIQMSWVHAKDTLHQQSNNDGTTKSISYPHTNAEYVNIFWPALGVIFANRNYGARYMIDEGYASVDPWKDNEGKPLPTVQLKQWSDVLFLTWQHLTTDEERANIRWVARRIITNALTRQIIGKACKNKGNAVAKPKNDPLDHDGPAWRAPVWPGVVFRNGEAGFNALLATPNAKGVVWFLVQ